MAREGAAAREGAVAEGVVWRAGGRSGQCGLIIASGARATAARDEPRATLKPSE